MCRLFGYAGPVPATVDWALMQAENSLERQSTRHRDGWGIGYFRDGRPHLRKSTTPAFADRAYGHALRTVESTHVIGHVRRATVGGRTLFNNHPFHHEGWIFAHNGTLATFPEAREAFLEHVAPDLQERIQGATDSEILFHLLLTLARDQHGTLDLTVDHMVGPVRRVAAIVAEQDAAHEVDDPSGLNILLSNGRGLLATRRGRDLHLHRPVGGRCIATAAGTAVALPGAGAAVASEPLGRVEPRANAGSTSSTNPQASGGDAWEPVPEGSVVLVTSDARVRVRNLS